MTARLTIRRLALHGFTGPEALRIEAGFRAELSRVDAQDLPQHMPAPSGPGRIDHTGTPEQVGAAAARALIARLGP